MRVVWFAGFALFALPGPICAQDGDLKAAQALERTIQRVIDKTEPAVASILVSRTELYQKLGQDPANVERGKLDGFDPSTISRAGIKKLEQDALLEKLNLAHPRHVPESFGSGVVIDSSGLILTNYHVVRDATKIYVRLPGGKASYADIHAADARADLAVLRMLEKPAGLSTIQFGDAAKLKRGQFLVTLGNPFAAGFRDGQPSATWGILSNKRRRIVGMRREEDLAKSLHQYGILLQTDFRLNLGSSGAPVFNLEGEMVGLSTAWAGILGGDTPGGFALPIDIRFKRIVEVLKRGEEVEYGFLGIALPERDADEKPGVVVAQVYPGSPAERDGKLMERDRIVAVNGEPIEDSDDLFFLLGAHLAETKVRLDFVRPGVGKKSVMVTLAKFWSPGKKIASSLGDRPFVRGIRVDDASILVQQLPRWPIIPPGVVISDVQKGSAADKAGLNSGDVVFRIGGDEVLRPADFYRLMSTRKGPVEYTLWNTAAGGPGQVITVK